MENKRQRKANKIIVVLVLILSLGLLGGGGVLAYFNFVAKNYLLSVVGIVFALLGFAILVYFISTYNKFIRYVNKVDESLSLIDVHLKARFDLIPNLVNTVKGYCKHEQAVFTEISELRSKALEVQEEKEKIKLANKTLPKINEIIMIAESYPELKADRLYRNLMEELVEIEDKIVASRRFYDSNVNIYNTSIEVWPASMIARMFDFSKSELFKIDAGERLNINIDIK